MNSHIEVRNLSLSYDDKPILNNVNMNIPQGKITAIIGPSGCGKSTFLRTLNRMAEDESNSKIGGEVLFQDKNIKNIPKEEVRRKIGLVFQKSTCFPFSIYKNLIYAPIYYGMKDKNKLNELVKGKLKAVGLYDEVQGDLYRSALKLSGGQQQRLCIARALTVEPEVLMLDEPCSSLDIQNTMNIESMLKELSKEYTILIVTHNLSQAKRIAEYTAFLLNGKLIEFGKTKEIFENPKEIETQRYMQGIYG